MGADSITRRTRQRVPPRRRRPRRSLWKAFVWPAIKTGALVFALGAVVWFGTKQAVHSVGLLSSESRETRRVAQGLVALRAENASIERQIAYTKTERGQAAAARKYGLVKPGERTIVLPAAPAND